MGHSLQQVPLPYAPHPKMKMPGRVARNTTLGGVPRLMVNLTGRFILSVKSANVKYVTYLAARFPFSHAWLQIASNRYAPHLSSCLGMGNRRGSARNANAKSKLAAEGRSASPLVPSENGYLSDDARIKGKGRSKAKRTDEAEFNVGTKRTGSPSISPAKKSKKAKGSASPSKAKTEPGTPNMALSHATSLSKVPSKLRESSVISSTIHDDRLSSPEGSRFSTPERSAATPTSTLSAQSPLLAALSGGVPGKGRPPPKNGNSKLKPNGIQAKRPSPPRPPPPPPVARLPELDYVDVEGEETGSSTDDSS
ncbi:hypothetical protein QCA50_001568 [Cerrena zonata]|uniref:SAGA-associated factor 11 n=1 Tax=Cerrena zonata TaxID=2478898 RepID=A0AAW0GR50_9APHY